MYMHRNPGFIIMFYIAHHQHAFPAQKAPYISAGFSQLLVAQGINGLELGRLVGRIYSEQDAYTQ